MPLIKEHLIEEGRQSLQDRISLAKKMIQDIQEAANEETKSSAGDKYETTRAMLQLEKDKAESQLSEALKLLQALDKIEFNSESKSIRTGSLIHTNQGVFFLAIGLGKVELKNKEYYLISPVSPLGQALMNKKVGDEVKVNDRTYNIDLVE